ncbi:PREDICTED: uncharacterized protein LOC109580739 [Amphimedon queenslandica]|uniref:Uncharacterized protein n=1 Tax=Amphimedon queenslandica TaxID=400682 RepID=A0A1X7VBT4_AMPQE|nr:PREDICTED: uncharacterized protein LOC109580739 [Amphimedon queenslandica]|eukprot:XP_019849785.1 PREDICTED: uncharacterized protein LOC109580739 [Amphimedon queenslandica]
MEKRNEERKKSFLDDGTEETSSTGNTAATAVVRRRTAKIIRRKEPTVDLRTLPPVSLLQPATIECYSTVESASVHTLDALGSYYTAIVDEMSITGWRIDEHKKAKQELSISSQHLQAANRQALQSRESSCNRLYSSRLNSRLTKRREQYSFKHSDDIDDHLSHYINHCSFSFLLISSKKKEPLLQELPEQSDSTHEAVSEAMHRRRSGTTRNDYSRKSNRKLEENDCSNELCDIQTNPPNHRLHSLASKLGVEDSIHKPTLVHLSKAKTASTNMRRSGEMDRVAESLMVTGASDSKETKLVDLADKNRRHLNSSRQPSRQSSSRQSSRHQEHNFSALSKPIKKERKDPSTISISKYLNINNRSERDKEGEEKKDERDKISELEEKKEKDEEQHLHEAEASCSHSTSEPWPDPYPIDLMADTGIKKDIVIRRTADSLGLHSHKWAKDFMERGFLNGRISRNIYYHYSRPGTREGTREGSASSDVSAIEKNKEMKPRTERAVTTRGERNKADTITEKLQKLESVYFSGSCRRPPGAGGGMNSACKRKIIKGSVSRPQTQANVHKSRRQYHEGGGEEREKKRSGMAKWAVTGERWQNMSPIKLFT